MAAVRALMAKLPRSLRRSCPLSALSNPQPPPSIRRFYTTPPTPPLPETLATRTWATAPRITMFSDEDTDFEHWVVVMDFLDPNISPDQKIQAFISTLAQVVGSEEEAKMKIYSMSLKHIIDFGARIPVDLTHKIRELPNVGRVLPDSYVDEENKVFGNQDSVQLLSHTQGKLALYVQRRITGLHQITDTGSTDTWEPLEESLLPLETTRHVSMITITLS